MKKWLLFLLFVQTNFLFSQITVDGDASEWTGTAPGTDNTAVYSPETAGTPIAYSEWIWKDAAGDHRTDNFDGFVDASKQDLLEFRLASDGSNLFFLGKFPSNIDKTPGNGSLQIQISLRRSSSSSSTEFLAGFADTRVPTDISPGGSISDSRWDYLIVTRFGSSNTNNRVWNSDWSSNDQGSLSINATNGIIEGSVPWSALGNAPNSTETIFITVSLYRVNNEDNTFDTGGDNSKGNCLDYITTTAGNTYGALIGISDGGTDNQGRLDYSVGLQMLASGQVLPVELTSFTANVSGKRVTLNWTTATEINNYGFEVERKQAQGNWNKIGFVNGHGNSNSAKEYSYTDKGLAPGKYLYRLKQIDTDGTYEYSNEVEAEIIHPKEFVVEQNYPNPFNPETRISFALPQQSHVKVTIFNILGQEIETLVNETREAGQHTIDFNADGLNSGVYLYKIEAGSFVQVKKMILNK